MSKLWSIVLLAIVLSVVVPALSQKAQRRPLAAADVDAITQLVMLEHTRQFDQALLTKPIPSQRGRFDGARGVVRGMEAVDRLELGDAITAARMLR